MTLSPLAGKPAPASVLVDIPRLLTAYYTGRPAGRWRGEPAGRLRHIGAPGYFA